MAPLAIRVRAAPQLGVMRRGVVATGRTGDGQSGVSGLIRASLLYTLSNMLPKVGAVFLVPIYVHLLSAAEYGTVALLTTLVGFLSMVYRLGMDGSLIRLHFDLPPAERGRLYLTAMLFGLAVAAFSTLALILLGPALFSLLPGQIPFMPLGLLALLLALVSSVGFVPSSLFRATRQAGAYAMFNLGGYFLTSFLVILMVVVFRWGALGVLAGQAIAGAFVLLIAVAVVLPLARLTVDFGAVRQLLSLGMPLLPHAISGWALKLLDRWLIGLFIGLSAAQTLAAVGAYSFGYQIGSVVTILVSSFNSAWAPFFYGVARRPAAPRLYREMTTIVLAGVAIVAVGLSATSVEVVDILARRGYEKAADVISVVALGAVVYAAYTMFVVIVFVAKRTGRLALLTGASVLVNLVLNAVLIPRMGILGAAWATVGSYAFFAVVTWLYARNMYPMRIDLPRLAIVGILGVATAVLARMVHAADRWSAFFVHTGIALLFAVAVLVIVWRPLRVLVRLSSELRGAGEEPADT